jgi:hypothetical protein
VNPVVASAECDGDLELAEGLNRVLKQRADLPLVKLELVTALWGFGAPIDEVDSAVGILEVSWRLVRWVFMITLR